MPSSALKVGGGITVAAVAVLLLGLPAPGGAAEGATAATETGAENTQSAVWTQKELTFTYQGFTTRYSCDGLRDKVRGVLLDLGVQKKDLQVRESGCGASTGRPDPFPGVRIKMSVLTPAGATDENPIQAHWKPVDLKLRDSYSNDSGECELIEQIRSRILPLFSTRNVELSTNCIPHQVSASRPILKMEVLAAQQKGDKRESPGH